LKTGEFRHHIERRDLPWQLLSDQFDASGRSVPEKMGCTIKMPNKAWVQSHQPCTREICGDWIVCKNDLPEVVGGGENGYQFGG
jgi:hypothetical protein